VTIYCYDGSFAGFITVLACCGESGECPADITRNVPAQRGLFCEVSMVETDWWGYGRFLEKIARVISRHALRNAYHAFLSEDAGIEMAIHRYLSLGLLEGRRLDALLADKRVRPVHKAARKVRNEAHRMKGFVRFREVRHGFFYAALQPDCRIFTLIAPHFCTRFSDQNWVIHDMGRKEAVFHDASRQQWAVAGTDLALEPEYTDREMFYCELWRRYFSEAAIAERHNPALQKHMLPLKYRKYLVEMENGGP